MVVTVGVAITDVPVVALNAVEGVQVYVVPPPAVSVTLLPGHIAGAAGPTVTVGVAFTVIIAGTVSLHPKALFPTTE